MRSILKKKIEYEKFIAVKDDLGNELRYGQAWEMAFQLIKSIGHRKLILVLCDRTFETISFLCQLLYTDNIPLLIDAETENIQAIRDQYQPAFVWKTVENEPDKDIEICYVEHALYKLADSDTIIHSDLAILLSTSGSTGTSKMVKQSYGNWELMAESAIQYLRVKHGDRTILAVPEYYVMGLWVCIHNWYTGATVYITKESVLSPSFKNFFVMEQINSIHAVPTIYIMLTKVKFWDEAVLKNLKFIHSGGERLREKDYKQLQVVLEDKIILSYGQSECAGGVLFTKLGDVNFKEGIIGKSISEKIEAIVNQDEELVIKGSCVCMGYAESSSDLWQGDVNRGVLYTGDLVCQDEKGYLYIKGRKKRIVKINGERISLDDLEIILNKKFCGFDFLCTGETDELCIYSTECMVQYITDIKEYLFYTAKIPLSMICCVRVPEIPKLSNGKVDYNQLKSKGKFYNQKE